MKAILALLALAGAVVVIRIRRDARVWEADEHEATVPMTWSVPTGTTYYYNPRTGVLVSAN